MASLSVFEHVLLPLLILDRTRYVFQALRVSHNVKQHEEQELFSEVSQGLPEVVAFELSIVNCIEQAHDLVRVGDLSEPVQGVFVEEEASNETDSEVPERDDVQEDDLDLKPNELLDEVLRVPRFVCDDQEVDRTSLDVIV